jgi:hypothetical protein
MENEKISEVSKNVVIKYFEDMKLKNLKPNTIELNVNVMMFILKNIKNDLDKLNEEDSRSFQIALLSSGRSFMLQTDYLLQYTIDFSDRLLEGGMQGASPELPANLRRKKRFIK